MEVVGQRVEIGLPEALVVFEVFRGALERAGHQAADDLPAAAGSRDQSGTLEHVQMARDGGPGDCKRLSQPADRGDAGAKRVEQAAASRVGQRGEDVVERAGGIINHHVKYYRRGAASASVVPFTTGWGGITRSLGASPQISGRTRRREAENADLRLARAVHDGGPTASETRTSKEKCSGYSE